jgi:ABC-type nitrate/sulfonate/bicarbonate transport system permease component
MPEPCPGTVGWRLGRALVTIGVTIIVLVTLWALLLAAFDVSSFVGKSPWAVWQYLFADAPARGIRPASLSAGAAREAGFGALGTTLVNAAIGFGARMVIATVIAVGFVLYRPFEFALMPIAMLLRSVPLVAMPPLLLLLIFGQGKLGIAAIVVLFPALVNIVLGLSSAAPQALDVIRVNGGSELTALRKVRVPSALPQLLGSARISVPARSSAACWPSGWSGSRAWAGCCRATKGAGNYGGVWTIVALSVLVSIVLYEVMTVIEAAVLARWGPNAGLAG